jgi:hypothetical protein
MVKAGVPVSTVGRRWCQCIVCQMGIRGVAIEQSCTSQSLVRLEYTSMGEVQRYIQCQERVDELGRIYGEIEKEQGRGTSHGVYKECQG